MDNNKTQNQETSMVTKIMGLFALVVLCAHPLVVTDAYFNILETKYLFYCGTVITMLVLLIGCGFFNDKIVQFFEEFNLKLILKSLSLVDWAMIAFWVANVLSWVFCEEWRHEAFWGTSGRYNGVFLMTLYMVVYFCVTRLFELKRWYLDAFLATGMIVCLFGITDYFQMDIMSFKVNMIDSQKGIYTSTLGNINTYTVFVAAVMVVSTILFATEKNGKKIAWYYVNMVISCFALIMGASDNAYLSLAALFGLSPLYLFRTKRGTSRYLVSIATFFTVIMCIDWINGAFGDTVVGIESAFAIIAGVSFLPIIVLALWAVAGGMTYILLKKNAQQASEAMPKWLMYIWYGVIVLVVGTVAFAFYDATFAGNSERYGALAPYVTFNDAWGTNRGYAWRCAMEIWSQKLTPVQKIFGYGADTFRLLMYYYFSADIINGQQVVYDSVHNEYLNFLLTIGIVGMLAYIAFLFAAVAKMWKHMNEDPDVAAILFVVVAYMVQATININLPILMPIILQLLLMGLAKVRQQEKIK